MVEEGKVVFSRFEDILSWEKGKELTVLIYDYFRNNKDYSFKDQIQRASISIMNNISEGFERGSNKDFIINPRFNKKTTMKKKSIAIICHIKTWFNAFDFVQLSKLQPSTLSSPCS